MKTDLEPSPPIHLTPAQQAGLLALLRDARATVQRDSESFDQAASMLEHVGQILAGQVRNGLGHYRDEICNLAKSAPNINSNRVDQLFSTVRNARNDAVHGGSYIRHHANHLVNLLLILEEALMAMISDVRDLMVQNPVTAELWHNIAAIRRAMLANAFSYLPVKDKGDEWRVISVFGLVSYMESAAGDRNKKLGRRLDEALASAEISLEPCNAIAQSEKLSAVYSLVGEKPVLVLEEHTVSTRMEKRLVGILTAFDLL